MEELDDGRTLARVIEASAATLVVLDSDAFALTRLWCLYETRRLWAHFAVACLLTEPAPQKIGPKPTSPPDSKLSFRLTK